MAFLQRPEIAAATLSRHVSRVAQQFHVAIHGGDTDGQKKTPLEIALLHTASYNSISETCTHYAGHSQVVFVSFLGFFVDRSTSVVFQFERPS